MSTNEEFAGETERLWLRDYRLDDAPDYLRIFADPEVMRYVGGVKVRSESEARAFLERMADKYGAYRDRGLPYVVWAAIEKKTEAHCGTALFKPLPDNDGVDTDDLEIGWYLERSRWGRGYATEIGRALVRRAFATTDIDVLHVVIDPGNERSAAVADRLGMNHQGLTHRYYGRALEHFTLRRGEAEAAASA